MDNDTAQREQELEQARETAICSVAEEYNLDEDAFRFWCDNFHVTDDYEAQVRDFEDSYCGCWDTFQSYAEEVFDDTMDVPDHLSAYIDYEKWSRDLQYDYWTGDDTAHGVVYVFRNY